MSKYSMSFRDFDRFRIDVEEKIADYYRPLNEFLNPYFRKTIKEHGREDLKAYMIAFLLQDIYSHPFISKLLKHAKKKHLRCQNCFLFERKNLSQLIDELKSFDKADAVNLTHLLLGEVDVSKGWTPDKFMPEMDIPILKIMKIGKQIIIHVIGWDDLTTPLHRLISY